MTSDVSRCLYRGSNRRGEIMPPSLIMMLLESRGYLEDEGWHQTAQLMELAAMEIEALNTRIAELEAHLRSLDEACEALGMPEPSNRNATRVAAISSWR